jgi:hypothetical protein
MIDRSRNEIVAKRLAAEPARLQGGRIRDEDVWMAAPAALYTRATQVPPRVGLGSCSAPGVDGASVEKLLQACPLHEVFWSSAGGRDAEASAVQGVTAG